MVQRRYYSQGQYFNAANAHMKKFIILGIQFVYFALNSGNAQTEPIKMEPFDLCHVLQNLDSLAGKIIQVRGEWQGAFLVADKCPKPLIANGHEWPNAINLDYSETVFDSGNPVDWIFGPEESDPAFKELERVQPGPVYATIVGRLDVRSIGYGHLNYYPARIVMIAIRNIISSNISGKPLKKGGPLE
jgi:hypothetical protein